MKTGPESQTISHEFFPTSTLQDLWVNRLAGECHMKIK